MQTPFRRAASSWPAGPGRCSEFGRSSVAARRLRLRDRRRANCNRAPSARGDRAPSRSPITTRRDSGSIRTTNLRSPSATPRPLRCPTVKLSMPSCSPTTVPSVVTSSPAVSARRASAHEFVVAAARDEADLLAVLLLRHAQAQAQPRSCGSPASRNCRPAASSAAATRGRMPNSTYDWSLAASMPRSSATSPSASVSSRA